MAPRRGGCATGAEEGALRLRGKLTRMWAHVAGIALVAGARVPDAECGSSPKRCFPLRQAHKTHQLLSFPSPVAQTWFAPTAPGSGKTHRLAGSRFPLCSSPLCGGPAGFQPAPGDHTHGDEPHVRKKKEERGEGASPVHTRRASCFGKGSPWRRARTRRLQAESNGQAEASRASARARHSRPPALQSANYARHRTVSALLQPSVLAFALYFLFDRRSFCYIARFARIVPRRAGRIRGGVTPHSLRHQRQHCC